MNIEAYIRKLEQEKRLIRQELYCQSLCTGIAYDEIAIHAKAPKIDYLVADNVEDSTNEIAIERRRELLAQYKKERVTQIKEPKKTVVSKLKEKIKGANQE